jgi:undecaprenyl pyrophosphate synthase
MSLKLAAFCSDPFVLWSDFDQAEFDKALASFSKRERRMGGRGGSAS